MKRARSIRQKEQPEPRKKLTLREIALKGFIWIFLAIFLFGSLGVALIATR
jgi:hypothetical protein